MVCTICLGGMRALACFTVALCILRAHAQELIPNGGLEQFGPCPDNMGQLERATGWSRPTLGSSDYFNGCQTLPNNVGVPANLFGEQAAHSGNGYGGIICFFGPENMATDDTHEYMSHALAAPLVPGESYSVEFFVSLADLSKYAVNDLSALFSVQPPLRNDLFTITATPQIMNTSLTMLDNTTGWTRINGCFTADSAYAYITIGNFHTGYATVYEEVTPTWSGSWYGYYLVDDVSVQHVPRPYLGPDLLLCEPATISVLDPLPGAEYLWCTGATGTTLGVDTPGTYTVQLADAACPLTDTIVVRAGVPVSFLLSPDTTVDFCLLPGISLEAGTEPPTAQLAWSTGETTASIRVNTAGDYVVHASAVDHCDASASIRVIDTCGPPVYAPDAFTPNGDGINDLWRPVWSANPGATLRWSIYDRWGQLLFSSMDAEAWDGSADGAPVPNGLYEWRGHANDPALHAVREPAGYILLMR